MTRSLLLFVICLCSVVSAQEITSTTEMERQIFEWTNQERAKVNAPPLTWDNRLAIAARLHSDEMAKQKNLTHQLPGEAKFTERLSLQGARFSAAAENVGYGDDAETLQSGWMHSPGHRTNLLNPAYNQMGMGIVRSGNQLWATEDFATGVPRLSSEDFEQAVEKQIASLRRKHGLPAMEAVTSTQLRRIACAGDTSGGAAMAALPRRNMQAYSFNFTTPNAADLPNVLTKRVLEMPSGGYSIGACLSEAGNNGMSTYRVLIALYR
ncbi:MAG TPA: CAP domain-containing protein [Terriglobales bacterium]|nr:CAP domain-containing protein [Terriglobales bacterium]